MIIELIGGPHDGEIMLEVDYPDAIHLIVYDKDTFWGRLFGGSRMVKYEKRSESEWVSSLYEKYGSRGMSVARISQSYHEPYPFDYKGEL